MKRSRLIALAELLCASLACLFLGLGPLASPAFAGGTNSKVILPTPMTVSVPGKSSGNESASPAKPATSKNLETEVPAHVPAAAPAEASGSREQPAPKPTRSEVRRPTVPRKVRRQVLKPVEPASGRIRLIQDTYVFARPSRWSKHIARVHARYYVIVTGTTEHYVRVRLKSGQVGFVSMTAVTLTAPTEKVFSVLRDSPVYETPNTHSRHVARVYTPGKVLVIGAGLGYLKVRMHNGVEGYVPADVFE